jgi:hypothetical protein
MNASSASDPIAMSRNRRNSGDPRFADPSAMLAAAENAARRACDVTPYSSYFGKELVDL